MEIASTVRLVILPALASMVASCEPPPKLLSVPEVIARIDRLNGSTVSVEGYLPACFTTSCRLYQTKADADEVDRSMTAMRAALAAGATDVSSFKIPRHPSLGIGTGSPFALFDLKAFFLKNRYVVITGKVSNKCRGDLACLDRAEELEPTAISIAYGPPRRES